ncbi:glutathione transferase [Hypoxylon sp. EC38]|nr:glutathione transferase [Hypoxylon sp. EC38]
MKSISIWLFPEGPNPLKVLVVLEELQIPYEIKTIKMEDVKKVPLIKLNPNGRVLVIDDPNKGLILWESCAIITYLIDEYDTNNTLTYVAGNEKYLVNQWLYFQASGQGPYFGQAAWFMRLHPEKLQSAIERYQNEIRRVMGVVEGHLSGRQWLVGDKMTCADLAWVPWTLFGDILLSQSGHALLRDYPNVEAWYERIASRPSWKKVMEMRSRLLDSLYYCYTNLYENNMKFA